MHLYCNIIFLSLCLLFNHWRASSVTHYISTWSISILCLYLHHWPLRDPFSVWSWPSCFIAIVFNPNELVVVLYFTAIKQHYHYIYVLWFPYLYYFKLSDVKNFIFAKHKGQSGDKYIFALRLGNIPLSYY